MLPNPYHWLDNPDTCYLCFNYGTVAVLEMKEGRVAGRLHWQGRSFEFKARSYRQAKMWVERWIAARGKDLPSRPVKPRRRTHDKAVLQALIRGTRQASGARVPS